MRMRRRSQTEANGELFALQRFGFLKGEWELKRCSFFGRIATSCADTRRRS